MSRVTLRPSVMLDRSESTMSEQVVIVPTGPRDLREAHKLINMHFPGLRVGPWHNSLNPFEFAKKVNACYRVNWVTWRDIVSLVYRRCRGSNLVVMNLFVWMNENDIYLDQDPLQAGKLRWRCAV